MKIGDNMTKYTCFYYFANRLILAIILILLTTQSFTSLSSAVADYPALIKLISQNQDPRMDVNDLAFLLVTHDFDAVPKKDHVEVRIDDTVYNLVPNGQYFRLNNATMISR